MDNYEKRDIVDVIMDTTPDIDLEERPGIDRPYLIARCPFHDDSNPSFVVFPETQRCKCYSCWSEGGDVIDYVRKRFNMSFVEAREIAATRLSVEETLSRHIKAQKMEVEPDANVSALRAYNLFSKHSFEHATHVCKMLDELILAGKWAQADQLLKREGV